MTVRNEKDDRVRLLVIMRSNESKNNVTFYGIA